MKTQRALIIAEAGVNHNGSLDRAIQLVDVAKSAGVDIIKFQTFKADSLVTRAAKKAEYQANITGAAESQYDMLKKLELSFDEFVKLAKYCQEINIEFLSTAFDEECLKFLVEETGIKRIKMPSGEITNGPLMYSAARTSLPLILSTGMSTLKDIRSALDLIAAARAGIKITGTKDFQGHFKKNSRDLGVQILHCTSEYPAKFSEINLQAMLTLQNEFGLEYGLSDHSEGIIASVAAVAMGAVVIEKHFTLDKNLPGPDHRASLDPNELKQLVTDIRCVETMQGSGLKTPFPIEIANAKVARKSVTAAKEIKAGDILSEKNLCIKRPGNGVSPMDYWDVLGKKALRSYQVDEAIGEDQIH